MTNLDSIFKSRDITLLTKVHLVKAMVFPVVMYYVKYSQQAWPRVSVSKCHFIYKREIPVLPAPNALLRHSPRVLEKWFEKLKG